jgi:hypothetical protein
MTKSSYLQERKPKPTVLEVIIKDLENQFERNPYDEIYYTISFKRIRA